MDKNKIVVDKHALCKALEAVVVRKKGDTSSKNSSLFREKGDNYVIADKLLMLKLRDEMHICMRQKAHTWVSV